MFGARWKQLSDNRDGSMKNSWLIGSYTGIINKIQILLPSVLPCSLIFMLVLQQGCSWLKVKLISIWIYYVEGTSSEHVVKDARSVKKS